LREWIREKGYNLPGVLTIEIVRGSAGEGEKFQFISPCQKGKKNSSAQRIIGRYGDFKPLRGEVVHCRSLETYKICRDNMILGRGEKCDITLDDETVSRQHARLSVIAGKILIEDLGSRNGTRVNHRIIGRAWLKPGDKIRLGESELLFMSVCGTSE
jgi:pSer/pThr/pTyr-binding forkhead associated (FHA) protein